MLSPAEPGRDGHAALQKDLWRPHGIKESDQNQVAEARIKAQILNRMTHLGMPGS